MVSALSPVAAASRNLSSSWLKGREGVHMPLDVRLSLNFCIHPQGSEVVARNPLICLRVCRVMHTSPRRVMFKRRKWFEHPFS